MKEKRYRCIRCFYPVDPYEHKSKYWLWHLDENDDSFEFPYGEIKAITSCLYTFHKDPNFVASGYFEEVE